jgi:hypothetical protein
MAETITLAECCWMLELDPLAVYGAADEGAFTVSRTKRGTRVVDADGLEEIRQLAEGGVFAEHPAASKYREPAAIRNDVGLRSAAVG